MSKPLRELLWFHWEFPRLPKPLVRNKYPRGVPWGPHARDQLGLDPRCPLVIDHVYPARLLVRRLLDDPPATPAALVRILKRDIRYVVLSREENRQLVAAKVGTKLPAGSNDPWDRYRMAGIELDNLRPLD